MNVRIEKTPLRLKLLLFVVLGIFGWSLGIAIEQVRLKSWPELSATITEFVPGNVASTGLQNWYANPKIRFAYEVDGAKFESEALNPSPLNYQSLRQFKSDTNGFHEGSIIKCWYNRSNPSVAYVINRGVTQDIGIIIIVTGFFTHYAGGVFVSRRLSRRSQSTE